MSQHYDAILIGTGQSTYTLVSEFQNQGWKAAVAEGGAVGGTCANFGCTPTKALVANARAAYMARRGDFFGVNIPGEIRIDFPKVMARMNEVRGSEGTGHPWLTSFVQDNTDFYPHYASFEGPNSVRVGDEVITGDRIYIHTGARARVPNIPGLDAVPYLTNVSLLELDTLPQHLVILGGSYIGMEFGQIFRRFGSEVTIIERGDQLMSREDADVAQIALDVFQREGINVQLGANVERVDKDGEGVRVTYTQNGAEQSVSGSHLLLAIGRVPNSDTLNAQAAGVEVNERGYIPVNNHVQTNVPHIYAVGDINGRGAFTHTSVNDGETIVDNLNGGSQTIDERFLTYALYMDPPLGRVGLNEKMAQNSDRKLLMGTMPMSSIARAREKGETDGIVKVFVDAETDQFVGATVFGTGGDEVVNMFTTAMYTGAGCRTFRNAVFAHPTVSELMPYVVRGLKPFN